MPFSDRFTALPPKPPDPEGRPVTWALITAEPGYLFDGHWTPVDVAWIDAAVVEMERYTRPGYYPAVLRNHDKSEGNRIGDVLATARAEDVDGRAFWIAAVAWNDSTMPQQIDDGYYRYGSPYIAGYVDELGNIYKHVLLEYSVVSNSHQKNLGPTHFVGAESGVNNVDIDALKAEIAALKAEIERLNAAAPPADMAEPAEPDPTQTPEYMALMAEVATLKQSARRAEIAALCGGKAAIMGERALDAVAKLDPEAFAAFKADVKPAPPAPARREAPGARMGEIGGLPAETANAKDIYNQALAEAGGDRKRALEIYTNKRSTL